MSELQEMIQLCNAGLVCRFVGFCSVISLAGLNGCSGSSDSGGPTGTVLLSTGGSTATGGSIGSGGAPAQGGLSSKSTATTAGGVPSTSTTTATQSTGGTLTTAGASSNGGLSATGGAPATGGASSGTSTSATGGALAGGASSGTSTSATGGALATGGASRGTRATGGRSSTGGAFGTGDLAAIGGASQTGGTSVAGGAPSAGGTRATGGSSNMASIIGSCDPSNLSDTTCLPPKPVIPTGCAKVTAPRTVAVSTGSKNTLVPESLTETLDTGLITQAFAINSCVELTTGSSGANAFLTGTVQLTSGQTLVIDQGVTVYGSRNPKSYGAACVVIDPTGAVSDTSVTADAQYDCGALFTVTGDQVAIVGQGTIDGQGGEPLLGVSPPTKDIDNVSNPSIPSGSFSWWNVSDWQRHDTRAQGSGPGSAPNPALIRVHEASNFVLYGLNLYNSAFFHVQLNSDKFVVWGINLQSPTNKTSSAGQTLSNFIARNTDGVDPGAATGITRNGYIVGCRISTGDDEIAVKGNAQGGANNIVIAHNHFGTGHGMSLGSATIQGITNVHVYDLTIDGDVPVDSTTGSSDLNGVRVKSYAGNGGFVRHVLFEDICTRDEVYPIYVTSNYDANPIVNPNGVPPDFQDIKVRNLHQLNVNGPQIAHEVDVYVEGNTSHQATINFTNVYVETSSDKKGGPVLDQQSTATLTGTMNVGDPPSNDPCTGKMWWPSIPTIP